MSLSTRCVILALIAAIPLAAASALAAEGDAPSQGTTAPTATTAKGADHPSPPCTLHGGVVKQTEGHYFETVFGAKETRIYVYDADQHPLHLDHGRGVSNVSFKDGSAKDGQVTFNVTRPVGEGDDKVALKFSGKVAGDSIDGKVDVAFGGNDPMSADWHAKRAQGQNTSSTQLTSGTAQSTGSVAVP